MVVTEATGLDVVARLAGTGLAEIRDLNPQYLRLATPPRTRSMNPAARAAPAPPCAEGYASSRPSERVALPDPRRPEAGAPDHDRGQLPDPRGGHPRRQPQGQGPRARARAAGSSSPPSRSPRRSPSAPPGAERAAPLRQLPDPPGAPGRDAERHRRALPGLAQGAPARQLDPRTRLAPRRHAASHSRLIHHPSTSRPEPPCPPTPAPPRRPPLAPVPERAAAAILGSMIFLILALLAVLVQTTWVRSRERHRPPPVEPAG